MIKALKIISFIILSIIIVVFCIFLYWKREQQIDFTATIPNEFEYCGYTINKENLEYIRLEKWFISNKRGWRNSILSYAPDTAYYANAETMSIIIINGVVVVNYRNKSGSWSQVTKPKKDNELLYKCKS